MNALPSHNRKHLYIVDDDSSMRSALTRALVHLGYEVQHFDGASEFLEKAVIFRPAVLLLDMKMPGMSGVQLQAALEEKDWGVPVIFMSGESTVQESITAMKQGALDFLLKPFSLEKLVPVIEKAIEVDGKQMQAVSRQHDCRRRLKVLTHRELEAYMWLTKGYSYAEMMQAMGISLPTAKQYKSAVMRKLEFSSLAELIEFDKELRRA